MAATSGTKSPDVEEYYGEEVAAELRREPWNFQFFQAVRLLERLGTGLPVGRFGVPEKEAVRFETNPALGFPPSQIHSLVWEPNEQPRMSVNFFGLSGQLGSLPTAYTEYINDRARARDHALRSFLDIFHHRLISLFYAAWEKYRFPVAFERDGQDRFTRYLLDFIGLGTEGLQKRLSVRDDAMAFYTGLLSLQPRSALALQQILSDYFEVPVNVEQFVGAWYPLSELNQSRVGQEREFSEQLGRGAVAGDEVWDQQGRARIVLGPMTLEQYLEFLPSGSAYAPLAEMTRFFSRAAIDFELQLVLRREETPPVLLDDGEASGPMLGWTTWLKSAPLMRDPCETVLLLQ
jgi:type VI secretion system protein ImpH